MADGADDTEKVKKEIGRLQAEIATQERTRKEANELMSQAKDVLSFDPSDLAAVEVVKEIEDTIKDCAENIEKFAEQITALQAQLPKAKWDVAAHPRAKAMVEEPVESAPPPQFATGEMCEARWTDYQWYKAKVRMVFGPPRNRVYRVRFVDYENEEMQVRQENVRPLVDPRKRKLETIAPPPPPPPKQTASALVISAPATKNPMAQPVQQEVKAATPTDMPIKKRKIGSSARLERGANDWKKFSKGMEKKTGVKKESMFRTSENPNARVGVSGSGPHMTKTAPKTRARNKFDNEPSPPEEEEEDRWEEQERLGRQRDR
ncbi:hypothetical protein P154DRAFT_574605 [Amniculicola lignicola CBS 123094]|uniref:Tudor domain-containing protein n=1 Tax=Amniculicola lignicola CBS 123094 TaxID=1392246 RepID=A0A6A5WS77_9PLEO|nr:hypothetical protein P154DRAFT_574605 [Amniculicola lignicola CBS 123094]